MKTLYLDVCTYEAGRDMLPHPKKRLECGSSQAVSCYTDDNKRYGRDEYPVQPQSLA